MNLTSKTLDKQFDIEVKKIKESIPAFNENYNSIGVDSNYSI